MFFVKPNFYNDFKCIASECGDNCCIGWEIDIDNNTLIKYKNINGAFGKRLKDNIVKSSDGSYSFKLCENERCPFLNENNLCDIIINYGEEYLCDICRNHPRFFQWFPFVTECGVGLSCEEAARLLLTCKKFDFIVEKNEEKCDIQKLSEDDREILEDYRETYNLRNKIFQNLLNEKEPFEIKKRELIEFIEDKIGEKLYLRNDKELIEIYKKTEPISEEFTEYINKLEKNLIKLENIELQENDTSQERVLAYIIYRHLSGGIFDYSLVERLYFALESISFIELMNKNTMLEKGKITLEDKIENIKNWSKQIEYSAENTELLIYGEE